MKPKAIAGFFHPVVFAVLTAGAIIGDVSVADETVTGNLTVTGDIDARQNMWLDGDITATGAGYFGNIISTPQTGNFGEGVFFGTGLNSSIWYDPFSNATGVSSAAGYGNFLWGENYGTSPQTKMLLDSTNKLSLYESDGSNTADLITLDPNPGKITLNGPVSTSGIYFGSSSTATLAASSTGVALFPHGAQVSGSPVITNSGLESALNAMTTPPNSPAWTTAYVKRGNIGTGGGLMALGSGSATGSGSVSLANGAVASGLVSLAWGGSTAASALGSMTLISGAKAYANHSGAIGYYSQVGTSGSALGYTSLAIGSYAKTQNDYSISLGSYAESSGKYSTSLTGGKASGLFSLAASSGHATGDVSIALGGWWSNGTNAAPPGPNTAGGNWSTAVGGIKNTVTGQAAYVSGVFNNPSAALSTTFGSAAVGGGTTNAWVEDEPLFELGNTEVTLSAPVEPTTGRTNAITTLKNGRTTLTNKAWKAAVTADPGDDETALADPAPGTDSNGNALVVDGHTVLNGKVTIAVPQGDISMGIYGD